MAISPFPFASPQRHVVGNFATFGAGVIKLIKQPQCFFAFEDFVFGQPQKVGNYILHKYADRATSVK